MGPPPSGSIGLLRDPPPKKKPSSYGLQGGGLGGEWGFGTPICAPIGPVGLQRPPPIGWVGGDLGTPTLDP